MESPHYKLMGDTTINLAEKYKQYLEVKDNILSNEYPTIKYWVLGIIHDDLNNIKTEIEEIENELKKKYEERREDLLIGNLADVNRATNKSRKTAHFLEGDLKVLVGRRNVDLEFIKALKKLIEDTKTHIKTEIKNNDYDNLIWEDMKLTDLYELLSDEIARWEVRNETEEQAENHFKNQNGEHPTRQETRKEGKKLFARISTDASYEKDRFAIRLSNDDKEIVKDNETHRFYNKETDKWMQLMYQNSTKNEKDPILGIDIEEKMNILAGRIKRSIKQKNANRQKMDKEETDQQKI